MKEWIDKGKAHDMLLARANLYRDETVSKTPGTPEWFDANAKYSAFVMAASLIADMEPGNKHK